MDPEKRGRKAAPRGSMDTGEDDQTGDDSMSIRVSGVALGAIQDLFDWGAMGVWTDSELIDQFLAGREEGEAAFRVLIQRHGPMVLGVCRRILRDDHAAEDAFQATFLVLVKKADRLKERGLLTNWLYGVALRVSQKERARGERRRNVERQAAESTPRIASGTEPNELRHLIDEEIHRLPERYRLPVLLCHVEGLRHDEVARRLGCPVGTVESRLSRAREQLRTRLARRGLAPSTSAMGGMFGLPSISPIPASLVRSTLRAAMRRPVREATILSAAQGVLGRAGRAGGGIASGLAKISGGMVIGMSIVAFGLGFSPAEPPNTRQALAEPSKPQSAPPRRSSADDVADRMAPAPRRTPRAVATPLSGITIDGSLDDWPQGLRKYPIANLLTTLKSSYRDTIEGPNDIEARFMAGYDANAGLLYLAVEVGDDDRVVRRASSAQANDAVEIYVDGKFSESRIEGATWERWPARLDASWMPALQYVGLAGSVPAYGDPSGANPALLYGKIRDPRSEPQMKFRRDGRMTTYEWAIPVYERFPDRPARLEPGKRIGLDVAVVDKDSGKTKPAFLTWGSMPAVFKGFDAGSLGELFLADRP
jgi:RNA polymerase sigma factor (sigma-70 family)